MLIPVEACGDMVEKAMLWYRENGYTKERFGVTIDRIGIETFEAAVLGSDLLDRKEEILAKPIQERP
jgi:dissimilatory sulfite reductase (desulfoviridin) alpha/beta subunit